MGIYRILCEKLKKMFRIKSDQPVKLSQNLRLFESSNNRKQRAIAKKDDFEEKITSIISSQLVCNNLMVDILRKLQNVEDILKQKQ